MDYRISVEVELERGDARILTAIAEARGMELREVVEEAVMAYVAEKRRLMRIAKANEGKPGAGDA